MTPTEAAKRIHALETMLRRCYREHRTGDDSFENCPLSSAGWSRLNARKVEGVCDCDAGPFNAELDALLAR